MEREDGKEKPRWPTRYGPKGPEMEYPQIPPEVAERLYRERQEQAELEAQKKKKQDESHNS